MLFLRMVRYDPHSRAKIVNESPIFIASPESALVSTLEYLDGRSAGTGLA